MRKTTDQMLRQFRDAPRDPGIEPAKAKFEALNEFVQSRGGWVVSVPADPAIRLQVLPGSSLPAQLAKLGYIVERTGETQRILPHVVTVKFTTRADGELDGRQHEAGDDAHDHDSRDVRSAYVVTAYEKNNPGTGVIPRNRLSISIGRFSNQTL